MLTRLRHCVDIILFNPPYVPTDHGESFHAQGSAGIAGSWAGGLDGMEVTNRFLDNVEVCPLDSRVTDHLQVEGRNYCRAAASFIS